MRLQLYLVLAAMCIQSVYPQYSVTISSITAPPDYKCHKTLVLRCQSNDTDCCSVIGKTRIWRKNGITIMNHGTESMTSGKYTEKLDDNQNYFELTIDNLDDNDFDQEYGCSYSFFSDLITLKSDNLLCPPCVTCGFILLAWTVVGACFELAITAPICYYKKMEFRKWCKALAITFAVTVVVNVVITLSIGNSLCICFDYFDPIYKDGDYKDWYFIALGLILSCLVPGLGVIITYATTKVLVADIGETVELKCLFKGSSGRQITWHKKDDERGTYSSNKEIKSNLPAELGCRLKVTEKFDLCISDVMETDAGIYECSHYGYSVLPFAVCRKQLIVKSGDKKPTPV